MQPCNNQTQTITLQQVPDDALKHCFSMGQWQSLFTNRRVCSRWNKQLKLVSPAYWKPVGHPMSVNIDHWHHVWNMAPKCIDFGNKTYPRSSPAPTAASVNALKTHWRTILPQNKRISGTFSLWCSQFPVEFILHLINSCPNLSCLILHNCHPQMPEIIYNKISEKMHKLLSLVISFHQFPPIPSIKLSKLLSRLKSLTMSDFRDGHHSDEETTYLKKVPYLIADHAPNLERLALNWMGLVDDKAVLHITRKCQNLTHLLVSLRSLSCDIIAQTIQDRHKIRHIYLMYASIPLQGTEKESIAKWDDLASSYPDKTTLQTSILKWVEREKVLYRS